MQRLTRLDNGVRIVSRELPSVETAAVGLHCTAGARHEAERENGLAHLFEHMVFKGAGGRSARQIAEAVEDVGGDLNAMTGREGTVFSARTLAEDVPLGLDLIADMILKPHFDAAELEREKQVVLQELGEVWDTPGDLVYDELQEAAYPAQSLGRSILGDKASIHSLTVDDLFAWRDRQYGPDELIVVAAGAVEHDRIVDLAARRFGDLAPRPAATHAPAAYSGGKTLRTRPTEQAHIVVGWEGPGVMSKGILAARLFGEAVGGGMSSRLFQALREDRGLAYTVYATHTPYSDTGLFTAYAATPREDAAAALDLMETEIAGAADGLTQPELDRARALAKSGLLMALESCEGQASYCARQLLVHGRLVEPAEGVADIEAITLDQVQAAGQKLLASPKVISVVGAEL